MTVYRQGGNGLVPHEMLVIYLALQSFAKAWAKTHFRVMCDNTTAVNAHNHMRTSHSDSCNSLAKEIWEWCIARDTWLSVAHIHGEQNLVADFESQRNQREEEWRLDNAPLQNALSRLNFQLDIDPFVSRNSYLFAKYVSEALGWFPRALGMLEQEPIYLKARRDLPQLPSHPQ